MLQYLNAPKSQITAALSGCLLLFTLALQQVGQHNLLAGIHLHHQDASFRPHETVVKHVHPTEDDQRISDPLIARALAENWHLREPTPDLKIAITVTTSDTIHQIRRWIRYNRSIGVSTFYLFVEGHAAAPGSQAALRKLAGVKLFPRTAELQYAQDTGTAARESSFNAFAHRPCNGVLFVKQSFNVEVGIREAQRDKMDWIFHVDTDELLLPAGSPNFSLQEVLKSVPPENNQAVFPNYEALSESEDVTDPFAQCTLFKLAHSHISSKAFNKNYRLVARGNPNYFTTYGNGKSGARVTSDVRSNGAHRFAWRHKQASEITMSHAALLHYTYNRFSDLSNRRDRCDCEPVREEMAHCFFLEFDREAFLVSSLSSDEEIHQFFRERLLWNQTTVVEQAISEGVFSRIFLPQFLLQRALEHDPIDMAVPLAPAGESKRTTIDDVVIPPHLLEDIKYAKLPRQEQMWRDSTNVD